MAMLTHVTRAWWPATTAARPAVFTAGGAVLFFLSSADLVLATRINGMNFRWAQILLFASALLALPRLRTLLKEPPARRVLRLLAAGWGAFFLAYGISALASQAPVLTGLKLGWGVFNIGGAAAFALLAAPGRKPLLDGLTLGCLAIALIVWVDAVAINLFRHGGPVIGLVQQGYLFEGMRQLRPHAFYYEPSYAGAALAFCAPLALLAVHRWPPFLAALIPGVLMSSVVLTSARTGILALVVAMGVVVVLALVKRDWGLLRRVTASTMAALVLLTVFFSFPQSRAYGRFIIGPLGLSSVAARVIREPEPEKPASRPPARTAAAEPAPVPVESDNGFIESVEESIQADTSEGNRVANFLANLRMWLERPLLGWGVVPGTSGEDGRRIHPRTMNTWLEVAVESGLLGFVTFLAAVGLTLWAALRRCREPAVFVLVVAACATHLLTNLNLTQTFPRLDYWLIFFAAVRAAWPEAADPFAVRD